MMNGAQGIIIQQIRIRESLRRTDPEGIASRLHPVYVDDDESTAFLHTNIYGTIFMAHRWQYGLALTSYHFDLYVMKRDHLGINFNLR